MQKIHRDFPFKFNGLDGDLFTGFNRKDFSKKLQSFGDDLPLKKFNDKSFEKLERKWENTKDIRWNNRGRDN